MVRLARHALVLAMILIGLVLCLDIAYLFNGSLEEFPTPEQQDKVRRVTAMIAVLLGLMEAGLWALLRQLQRSTRGEP